MQSAKKAKIALKENDLEFKEAGGKLCSSKFYKVMDTKAKSRKRARELSRDIKDREPPSKQPFRKGPPRGETTRGGHSR
jgi:hypothetical protein